LFLFLYSRQFIVCFELDHSNVLTSVVFAVTLTFKGMLFTKEVDIVLDLRHRHFSVYGLRSLDTIDDAKPSVVTGVQAAN
jgi:hypothetical protein